MVTDHHINSVDYRKSRSHKNGHPELFENHLENIFKMNLVKGNTADNQRRALGAAVSAGVRQHRDEGNEKRNGSKCFLIVRDDRLCQRRGKHQHQKPSDPVSCVFDHACFKIRLFTRA